MRRRLGDRPFRFHAMWLRHKDFSNWMKDNWNYASNLAEALNEFKLKLKAWNKNMLGNVFQRKKRNSLRLEGVKMALDNRVSW